MQSTDIPQATNPAKHALLLGLAVHMDALIGEDHHCKVLGRYSQGLLQKNEKVLGCGMLINGTLVMRPRLLKVIRGGPLVFG